MNIAVYDTGHEIADTVAKYLAEGLGAWHIEASSPFPFADAHIGYGILRKTGEVFRECDKHGKHWFEVDKGYFNPGHYDGCYRISHKGTQAKYDAAFPITREWQGELEPMRTASDYVLICPPTEHVCKFFGIDPDKWLTNALRQVYKRDYQIRHKDCQASLDEHLSRASHVITFNSSVGWQALIKGIPVISDPLHSVVGSYYNTISIDNALECVNNKPRKPLLDLMASHQFTLAEIAQGLACPLIKHYLSISAGIPANPSPPMSASTPSPSGLKRHYQSNT